MRSIPQAAVDLIKQVEGYRSVGYLDSAGVATDGFGNTRGAVVGRAVTEADATADLWSNLDVAAERLAGVVDEAVILLLTDNQYAALLSFVFNLGANPSWTIWKVLNARQFDQVPAQLIRFVYAGQPPVKVQGLVNRRTAEINLWSLDEPGSIDTSPSSSVTRATATPAVPLDPKPKGLPLAIGAAGTVVASAIPQAQGAVQAISDAITPYQDAAHIIGHAVNLLAVTGAGLAVAALVFKYLRDRQSSTWSKSTAPALHPTSLASESQVNPAPPGTVMGTAITAALPVAPPAPPAAPLAPNPITAAPAPSAGTTITADLAALRAALGRCLSKIGVEAEEFAGQTVSGILTEANKLAAFLESKL